MQEDRPASSRAAAATSKAHTDDQLLRAVLESAAQAIVTADENGIILSVNPKTTEMFGYQQQELIGQPIEILLPATAKTAHAKHRDGYFAAPRVRPMGVGMDLSGMRKNGIEFPVEISLSYTRSKTGTVAIAFISDVTLRKNLEGQLLQSQKMEAVGRLAGGIAHDFNNLLTIISGYDRMMLAKLSPFDPLRGFAEEILKASDRASALTRQLLAFSRRQMVQPTVLSINDVVRHSEKMLRRLITEDIELAVHVQPDLGKVKADPTQMEQVLLNLVVNARDALASGGAITIETANVELDDEYARTHLGVKPGSYVMLAVSDNGIGMDAETVRHIFEPFFTTKTSERGTGLGLSTVYGIVKQNQGEVWVYSELGKGTTLKIYLPAVPEESAPALDANSPQAAARGTERVLVVEDEPGVRQLLASILREHGYSVVQADGAPEALKLFHEKDGAFDLLITDVIMPHGNGRDLARDLTALRPNLKVLYISGYTENTIVHHGVIDQDVAFLAKPFSFESLLNKVRETLGKKE